MRKETITFKDLDGNDVTQEFYFGYNQTELSVMEISTKGGLIALAEKITNEKDGEKLMKLFQELILGSYGIKSADGIHFLKEDPVDHHKYADEFKQTDAYNVLFMKLANDDEAAADFFNGILPADAEKKVAEMKANEELPGQKNYKGPEVLGNVAAQLNNKQN